VTPYADRFWSKVNKDGPVHPVLGTACWLWTAGLNSCGYGNFHVGELAFGAHRIAYQLVIGEIPDGKQLDHLCRIRTCVNPTHVEPVTTQENTRRGESGRNMARKTHCPQGHPYEGDNLILYRGFRICRACRLAAYRRYRERHQRRAESSAP
jgi:hypothetical protein